jgi:RNA polymerase sigma-70 factor (ECF subfamily)
LGCDATLADDLTQETFLTVIKNPISDYNDLATAGYLRRVAYHLLLANRKAQGKEIRTDQSALLDAQWIRWAGYDQGDTALDALAECFEQLTERAQNSLRLRFQACASREEIARQLGITQDGAKNLMQRAKATLRECIERRIHEYR